jgi:ribose transport system permease protein
MTAVTQTGARRRSGWALPLRILQDGGLLIVLIVVLALITGHVQPRFYSRLNMLNMLREAAYLSIVSLGQMLVMIAGGFDLSVGVVSALASVVAASLMAMLYAGGGDVTVAMILWPVLAALAAGAVVGLANGFCVAVLDLSPFMTTLATTSVVAGGTLYYTQGIPIYGLPERFGEIFGRGSFLHVPASVIVALVFLALICLVQRTTPLGRHIYAVGSNARIAALSGVRPVPILMLVYGAAGLLAACMGLLVTARIGSGQATIGASLVIESISAAVIGGVPLRGGSGRAERVMLAAIFLTVVSNSMNLLRIDSKLQTLVQGSVVIIAIALERAFVRRRQS